ncbi:S8 family serine peptidase [Zobellia sp. B3R18]|uniref:S8 family serine peptidase n=1 Tax=Zobellia sp. B3R18 TaxID=2841568 RepID=UPI001C074CC5|nr:S8 family serine peptidase [Zobellia sp. B3R18]MBU2974965.1 S8 family serine peptidase [Zobellia sp. B3R18]
MPRIFYNSLLFIFLCSCSHNQNNQETLKKENIDWYLKDFELDSVPGISLERAYKELINEDKGKEIIVAVIDYQIDLNHEDLINQIYINKNEIPNNNIDDDDNGYIDDTNGWNFIGINDYESLEHSLDEYTRIVKRLQKKYKNKKKEDISPRDFKEYQKYINAVDKRNSSIKDADELIAYAQEMKETFLTFKDYFSDIYPQYDNYSFFSLDSLVTLDEDAQRVLKSVKGYIKYDIDLETIFEEEKRYIIQKYTSNNLNYNDRQEIGDDPYNYEDKNYGNNYVQSNQEIVHGTLVAGVLAATRNNGKGTRGVSNHIKIMPLPILPKSGTENDKDFYSAVRYAVDNGAKVINFSSSKLASDNEHILFKALKYAEENNVLVVSSGGNSGSNIGNLDSEVYPKDKDQTGNSVNNLIKVGASSQYLDNRLYVSFSNYSKENIDLFAPGQEIRAPTSALKRYNDNAMGTSISSAVTSGVAALLLSQYPDLSALQIKNILMDSGNEYNTIVSTGENDSIPFKELSKSGKILNAYKALNMAKKISEKQK